MTVRVEFKPEDLWVGAFWKVGAPAPPWHRPGPINPAERCRRVDLWICLVPMVPIHFTWYREAAVAAWARGG